MHLMDKRKDIRPNETNPGLVACASWVRLASNDTRSTPGHVSGLIWSGVAYGLQAATAWGTTPQQWEQRTELMRLERDAAVHFVSRRSSSFVQACTSPQLEFLLIQAYIFLIKPGCAKILNLLEGVVILPEHGDFPKYCNSKIFTRSLHERRIFDQQAARRILNSPLSWVCMKPCFWFLSRHIINYILQAPSRSNRSNAPFQV